MSDKLRCPNCGGSMKIANKRIAELEAESEIWKDVAERNLKAWQKLQAQVDRVRTAFAGVKWISTDKDNMEFTLHLTCFQKDAIQALQEKDDG